jgi:hypothetical protein
MIMLVVLSTPVLRALVVGLLCGEARYAGMPTGYWAEVIHVPYPTGHLSPPKSWWREILDSRIERPGAVSLADPNAVPVLIELLKDERWYVRRDAMHALALIGPEAQAAVPALLDIYNDPSAGDSATAGAALEQIAPDKVRDFEIEER